MLQEGVMLGESEFKGRWLFMLARGLEGGGRDCPSARSAFELSLVMHVCSSPPHPVAEAPPGLEVAQVTLLSNAELV